jgi:hypothetical protein
MIMRSLLAATLVVATALSAAGQQSSPPAMPDMMKMHQQMMADMKAANAKLEALVTAMNGATGAAKADAVAAVVNELARQHITMTTRMSTMHEQMMGAMGAMKR